MTEVIKKLDQLAHIPGKTIRSYEVTRLTAPGENYGSLMLSVDITFEGPNGTEKIPLVAKAVPPNKFIREYFNTAITFRNEIAFYKNIVPLLQDFQRKNGVKDVTGFCPKSFGSRLNLTGGESVDEDGVLLLENLKVENYRTLESSAGLDIDTTKLILADLAHLHAVPLAYKLRQPTDFARKIKPFLYTWESPIHENMKQVISELVDQTECLHSLKERVLEGFDRMKESLPAREPFATVTHNDCWTNNNMVKFKGDIPVKNKIVDYQMCSYGSPARDVLFFLFSSVKTDVIKHKYDDLIKWYHHIFVSVLEQLHCDTKPFTLGSFEIELNLEAWESQFGHVLFMLYPIFAPKEHVEDVSKLSGENIFSNQGVTDLHRKKLVFVVEEFAKRKWI